MGTSPGWRFSHPGLARSWEVSVVVLTGLLLVAGQRRVGFSWALAVLTLELPVLAFVAIDDVRHHLVRNVVTYRGIAAALAVSALRPGPTLVSALAGALFAAAPFLVASALRPAGVGMGDAKLALMVGAMTGLYPGFRVFLVVGGSLVAALVVAVTLLLSGRATRHTRLPYGALLALAAKVTLALLPP